MESLLSSALDAGLGAVALIALVFFVFRQQKDHKTEREAWKNTSDQQFQKIAEIGERQTRATEQYTGAVGTLRDLIQGRKRDD